MPTTVRAAVMRAANEPLTIESLELADPGPDQVRIKVRAAGLCHSDQNFLEGSAPHWAPVVLGHEVIGEVVELGGNVAGLVVGDLVIPYLIPHCGSCYLCRSGRTNQCVHWNLDQVNPAPTPFSVNGDPVGVLLGIGGFAEQVVVHKDQVVKVNPKADPLLACCLACGVTTGIGSALKAAKVQPGSMVAVFGLGGVGLGAVQGARLAGATTIIGLDTNPAKEEIARHFGATHFCVAGTESTQADIRAICPQGVDFSFDCVGRPAVIKSALAALDRRLTGVATLVGILPADAVVDLRPGDLFGATLVRTSMGNAQRGDVADYVDWFVEGKIQLAGLVSHRLPLERINEGFELMTSGQAVRVVLDLDS